MEKAEQQEEMNFHEKMLSNAIDNYHIAAMQNDKKQMKRWLNEQSIQLKEIDRRRKPFIKTVF